MRFLITATLVFTFALSAQAQTDGEHSPRFLVHLLDYLAKDYGGAVADGKILSESEYSEQVEFCKSAVETSELLNETKNNSEIKSDLTRLKKLILGKADAPLVAALARKIQSQVIEVARFEISPAKWPNLQQGKKLFAENCISCHGITGAGDGPVGEALDPKPANFLDEHMKEVSPFQAFNTIRLGVPGTGMQAFHGLSDKEVWDLAFFVVSLRHRDLESSKHVDLKWNADLLKKIATLSDLKLEETLADSEKNKAAVILALRNHSGDEDSQGNGSLAIAENKLDEALKDYKAGSFDEARLNALKAYLEGIEPVEPRLKASDANVVTNLEIKMAAVRGSIETRKPYGEVEEKILAAKDEINSAKKLLSSKSLSPWVSFLAAASILLREGFEAVLLIVALLGVIRATGSKKAALYVHGGWVSAVGVGVIAWFFSGWLIGLSGAKRETLEAITSLFAVVVLVIVGFWLHSQTEIGRWKAFIKNKVQAALDNKNLFTLASIAFVAVFREAFETVLFLRTLWTEGGEDSKMAVATGAFSSFVLVLFLAWALLKFSMKLPVRRLFEASAIIMAALAVILSGKGIHSLQETGDLSVSVFPVNLRLQLLGIFPTYETIASQILVFILIVALWHYGKRPSETEGSNIAQPIADT